MKKFLKILTLTGLTASLMITGSNFIENSSGKNSPNQPNKALIKENSAKCLSNKYMNINFSTKVKSNLEIGSNEKDIVNLSVNDSKEISNNSNTFEQTLNENYNQTDNTLEDNSLDENAIENLDTNENIGQEIVENDDVTEDTNFDNSATNDILNDSETQSDTSNLDNTNTNTNEEINKIEENSAENETISIEDIENRDNYDYIYYSADLEKIDEKYESLKTSLNSAIDETNKMLEVLNDSQTTLTDEQNTSILNQAENIKTLIDDLEDLTEEFICSLNGDCENENNEGQEFIALESVHHLSHRLDMLEQALSTINNLNSPNFKFYQNPYSNIYGFSYHYFPNTNLENEQNAETNEETEDADLNIANLENEEFNETTSNEKTETKNNKKFGELNLNSNVDTYGPRRRNIDTFFNTALLDDNMINGYNSYGYPNYMFGGNPYWNMGYNNAYYPNNFNGYMNSNYNNQSNMQNSNVENASAINISNEATNNSNNNEVNKPKKRWTKNIDSYTTKTLTGNINTMNGEKITDIIKNKFSQWFKKDKNTTENLNKYVDDFIDEHKTIDEENNLKNKNEDNIQTLEELENNEVNIEKNKPSRLTKDIKDEDKIKTGIAKIDLIDSEFNYSENTDNNQKNESEIKNIKLIKENHKNMIKIN
ncbi:MAG: hypothetical protein IJX26_04055 [Clostridia bacterium]|nr:hypothetical protein [Clostridia bacterium]